MPEITILHISDLHYDSNDTADLEIVKEAMLRSLEDEKINFIIFSGDLVKKGDESRDFDGAMDFFITPLLNNTNLSIDDFFIVPGNHDIQRSVVNEMMVEESGLKVVLTNRDDTNSFLDKHMMTDSLYFKKLTHFNNFKTQRLNSRHLHHSNKLYSTYIFEKENVSLGIASLNSTWRATGKGEDHDEKNLLIGDRQIREAWRDIRDCDVKIALFHHPLEWLMKYDQMNSKAVFSQRFDFLFCGHLHDTNVEQVQHFTNRISLFQGASIYTNRAHYNGYSILKLDFEQGNGKILFRTYFDLRDEFDIDTRKCRNGEMEFQIKRIRPLQETDNIHTNQLNTSENVDESLTDEQNENERETDIEEDANTIEEDASQEEETLSEETTDQDQQIIIPPRFIMFKRKLNRNLIQGRKLIEILTVDEEETMECIEELCLTRSWKMLDFSRTGELRILVESQRVYKPIVPNVPGIDNIGKMIKSEEKLSRLNMVLALRVDQLTDAEALALKELVKYARELEEKKVMLGILLICRAPLISPLLSRELMFVNFPLPPLDEVCEILVQDEIKNRRDTDETDHSRFEFLSHLAESLLGLNTHQIETVLAMARANNNSILDQKIMPFIHDRKRNLVKSHLPLSYKDWTELPDNRFQGYDFFIKWLEIRNSVVDAFDFHELGNITFPRGVIIHGPPGIGKTEAVHEIARRWKLPVLKLDLDGIYASLAGVEGEESSTASINLSRCLWTASQMAPIILSIENIDRHFGIPIDQNQQNDGQPSQDNSHGLLLNNFLNWMQENDSPVFVAATAMKIRNLDPEIWRKGRFDQVFYMAPPDTQLEKKLIAEFLRRRHIEVEPDSISLGDSHQRNYHDGWSPAGLEHLVDESIIKLYTENKNASPEERRNVIPSFLDNEARDIVQHLSRDITPEKLKRYKPVYGVSIYM